MNKKILAICALSSQILFQSPQIFAEENATETETREIFSILNLPDDILRQIFVLNGDYKKLMQVHSHWSNIISNDHYFWYLLAEKEFGSNVKKEEGWKETYLKIRGELAKLDNYGQIQYAIKNKYTNLFLQLLDDGIDEDSFSSGTGTPLLYLAAKNNFVDGVRILLSMGVEVDETNYLSSTALYVASQEGCVECVDMLLKHGADVKYKYDGGFTPLYIASKNGHAAIASLLIQKEAKVNEQAKDGSSPLYLASQEGHLDVVDILVKNGANIEAIYKRGFRPIYVASRNGHASVVRFLISKGADVEVWDEDESTSLYVASQNGHEEVVAALLEANAGNHKFMGKYSPTFIAAQNGHAGILRLLADAFPKDLEEYSGNGANPLYVAAQNGKAEAVKVLLEKGASVVGPEDTEYTPLWAAVQKGRTEVVKILLEHGAASHKDEKHYSEYFEEDLYLLQLADKKQSADIIKLLEEYEFPRN